MPLVTTESMLRDAQKGGYAVGAFNAENMEMVQAIIWAAEAEDAPVMVQISSAAAERYADPALYAANTMALAAKSSAQIALHLDHCTSRALVIRSVVAGFTSIMFDGSALPYEENIAKTHEIAELCAPVGIPVEAELGRVGGKEDDVVAEDAGYTDPQQAREFVERTGVQSLAVSIGTAHGVYKGEPKLDVERLRAIRALVDVPLVLHGASGVPDDQVRTCIGLGICKVNYATELRIAYTDAVRKFLAEDAKSFDPKLYSAAGRANVQNVVRQRIRVCRGN